MLDAISAELTTEDLTELNRRFDVDREDADAIAESWLSDHGPRGLSRPVLSALRHRHRT